HRLVARPRRADRARRRRHRAREAGARGDTPAAAPFGACTPAGGDSRARAPSRDGGTALAVGGRRVPTAPVPDARDPGGVRIGRGGPTDRGPPRPGGARGGAPLGRRGGAPGGGVLG